MHASTPTLLELCWSRGAPPKGPISPPNPTTPTRADFTIGYPIHLFRMFAPPATELFQSSSSPDEDVRYYVDRAVGSVVWNPASDRIQYDVYVGKSYFGVYSLGGNFASAAWFRALRPKCNCYDVAGISQLAMTMLVDDNGVEMGDSHWVFQVPNGFINPGPLIGWVKAGGLNLECNSPFWGHAGEFPFTPSLLPSFLLHFPFLSFSSCFSSCFSFCQFFLLLPHLDVIAPVPCVGHRTNRSKSRDGTQG